MFTISTKTEYGLRALAHLATCESQCEQSATIAREEGLPAKYLESILAHLKNAGLVRSERGKGGGYSLSKEPADISILEIIIALEGKIELLSCIGDSRNCADGNKCLPRQFWSDLQSTIDGFLGRHSLADILAYRSVDSDGCQLKDNVIPEGQPEAIAAQSDSE